MEADENPCERGNGGGGGGSCAKVGKPPGSPGYGGSLGLAPNSFP